MRMEKKDTGTTCSLVLSKKQRIRLADGTSRRGVSKRCCGCSRTVRPKTRKEMKIKHIDSSMCLSTAFRRIWRGTYESDVVEEWNRSWIKLFSENSLLMDFCLRIFLFFSVSVCTFFINSVQAHIHTIYICGHTHTKTNVYIRTCIYIYLKRPCTRIRTLSVFLPTLPFSFSLFSLFLVYRQLFMWVVRWNYRSCFLFFILINVLSSCVYFPDLKCLSLMFLISFL